MENKKVTIVQNLKQTVQSGVINKMCEEEKIYEKKELMKYYD